ncbi:MAG: ProQ/FinO family protein [Candidatus Competibacteraceae bacterium]|nr:ProQ/FinO family protein [Candidatus Competibacteraceae bacterium]
MILEPSEKITTTPAESRGEQTIALQSWLAREYPSTFNLDAPSPLKIGVHLDLAAQHPDIDPATLRRALKRYCERRRYQLALAREGAVRLDLDGQPAGEVTAEQATIAKAKLTAWKAKKPAKSAAQGAPAPAPAPTPAPTPPPPRALAGRPILRLKKPSPGVVAAVVTRREVKP